MSKKAGQIALPALRGIMGDWVYYSSLMDLAEISSRVRFAEEVHKNKALSDMIQRRLKTSRGKQISRYLETRPERFFNSLVVATYRGEPSWHGLSDIRSKTEDPMLQDLTETDISSVGFLTLTGNENLFALDGQHRLAGIKKAVADGLVSEPLDEVSVIFVAHKETKKGFERTRRLFTTLNKTAKPVSKGDIIALDEDDVMAITVRRLIEDTKLFADERRLAYVAGNNIPVGNNTCLTTIGNLYDVLTILFTSAKSNLKASKSELTRARPDDDVLDAYFDYARTFFVELQNSFPELGAFFSARDTSAVVKKFRGAHGGNALFRPIGLEVFTRIICRITNEASLSDAVKLAAKLPRSLDKPPFRSLMWDPSTRTILNEHKVTLREVLLYMLGRKATYSTEKLLERYRRETGDKSALLPKQLVKNK